MVSSCKIINLGYVWSGRKVIFGFEKKISAQNLFGRSGVEIKFNPISKQFLSSFKNKKKKVF